MKLSAIVGKLEQPGFDPFKGIEFDNGRWEIEVLRDGDRRELRVDPAAGAILADRGDD